MKFSSFTLILNSPLELPCQKRKHDLLATTFRVIEALFFTGGVFLVLFICSL